MTRSILTRRGLGNHRRQVFFFFSIFIVSLCYSYISTYMLSLLSLLLCSSVASPSSIRSIGIAFHWGGGGWLLEFLPRGKHPLSVEQLGGFPLCVNKNRNRKCERMLSPCITMMIVIFPCHTYVCQQMTAGDSKLFLIDRNSPTRVGRSLGGSVSSACVSSARLFMTRSILI